MERKEQTGHICRWMALGIMTAIVIVGCTIVIGLFEWRDRKEIECRNAELHQWRKNVHDLNLHMGDRRTEVNHPASGITSFTYDALGNVLTKQTANLAKEGKFISYDYDYQRLTGINYPNHLENNVKYYYGGRNASQNRIGRLMIREDGTGAIEYFYGKMGEVTKTRRTMIVPNQAIATYVTQRTYDSHNRLLEMIYPDEEKITYSYNLGGQLENVHGYESQQDLLFIEYQRVKYFEECNC